MLLRNLISTKSYELMKTGIMYQDWIKMRVVRWSSTALLFDLWFSVLSKCREYFHCIGRTWLERHKKWTLFADFLFWFQLRKPDGFRLSYNYYTLFVHAYINLGFVGSLYELWESTQTRLNQWCVYNFVSVFVNIFIRRK